LEAAALHLADYTSAQLAIFATGLKQVERPGNWSPYQRQLDRKLYASPRSATYTTTLRETTLDTYVDEPDSLLELTTPNGV